LYAAATDDSESAITSARGNPKAMMASKANEGLAMIKSTIKNNCGELEDEG